MDKWYHKMVWTDKSEETEKTYRLTVKTKI